MLFRRRIRPAAGGVSGGGGHFAVCGIKTVEGPKQELRTFETSSADPDRTGRGTPCLFTMAARCPPYGRLWPSSCWFPCIAVVAAFPSIFVVGVTGGSGIADRRAVVRPGAGSTGRRRSVIARRRTAGSAGAMRRVGIVVFTQKKPWVMRVQHRGLFRLLFRHRLPGSAGSAAGRGGL
jgi:hypothetical protein